MTLYAALIYGAELDRGDGSPREMSAEYTEFGQAAAAVIRGGAAPLPDRHRHHRAGQRRQGRRRGHHRRPVRRDQGGAHRLLPAGVRRPGRGGRQVAAQIPAAWNGAVEVRPVIEFRDRAATAHVREPTPQAAPARTPPRRPRPPRARRGQARAGHPRPAHRRPAARRGRRAGRRRCGRWRPGRATACPRQPRAWLTLTARRRAIDIIRREAARAGKEAEAMRPGRPPDRAAGGACATTCCGSCSPAATRRSPSRRRWRWRCARCAGCPPRRWAARCSCPRRRWPSGSPAPSRRSPGPASRTGCRPPTSCPDRLRGVAATVYLMFTRGTRRAGAPRSAPPTRRCGWPDCCAS